jgi:hypothetical protein
VKIAFRVSCALLVASCAIRPLPEQVTGITTFNIVKQIRCETREAVFNTFVKTLADNPKVFGESTQRIAEGFRDHPELMNQFKPALFTGDARAFVDYFWNTGIAYNFSLDMTEVNNLDAQIDFIQTLTSSTPSLGLGGGVDRQRENTRTFTLTDDFKGLLTLRPQTYCDEHLAAEQNQIYPIAGRVGIEPFVHEFVRLALFTNLGAGKDDNGAPTMVDTLQFQTLLSGSAVPKVIFSPVGRGFQLADASLTAQVNRKDIHTLTMGLSVIAAPPAQAAEGKQLFGRLLTSKGGGTRQAAANAVDQELTRQALSKTVVVKP